MTKDRHVSPLDPDGLKAKADRALRECKNLQDPGSEPMRAGNCFDLQEHRNAPRIRVTVPGESELQRPIDAARKREFQAVANIHLTANQLEDVVGTSIYEKTALKQRGLTEDSLARPYSGRVQLQDQQLLTDTAQEHGRWIGSHIPNPKSMQYIGEQGFVPKPFDCMGLTRDMPRR